MRTTLRLMMIWIAIIWSQTTPASINHAEAASCKRSKGIGVSRTVTLRPTGGARYGSSHGGHKNFLRDKEVVLTFDDGPVPSTTNKVLLELERHCTKATFFLVGKMAKTYPATVRKILAKGHTVGAHGYTHRNLGHTNAKTAIQDVSAGIQAVNKAAGRKSAPFFRFPYLSESKAVNGYLKRSGYGVFAIDVDSLDYRISSPKAMVNRVMSELRRHGKGIILMHDIQRVTANGIGNLLDRLKAEGYKIVHIRGRGGRSLADPMVVADNTQTIANMTLRSSIGIDTTRNTGVTSTFKRPKTARKRKLKTPDEKTTNTGFAKAIEKNQTAFRRKLASNKKKFRSSIKNRLITQ